MAAFFKASRLGQLNRSSADSYRDLYVNKPELKKAYRLSAVGEHARHAPKSHAYTISVPMQVRAVMRRRWQILKGDWATQAVQLGWVNVFPQGHYRLDRAESRFLQGPDFPGYHHGNCFLEST